MTKEWAISLACADNNYKWPRSLTSGVMFYEGHRITVQEFTAWANYFKDCHRS